MKKGQASLEFLVVVALLALSVVPLLMIMQWNSTQTPDQNKMNKASWSATRLAAAVDSVGSMGAGSRLGVQVEFPDVRAIEAHGREIVVSLQTSYGPVDAVYPTRFNVSGQSLGYIHKEGSYLIDVTASEDAADGAVKLVLR